MARYITYQGSGYLLGERETVLDCLLRHGQDIPSSCKVGACQSCLMQASDGTPTREAQEGLRETLIAQNYFLACQCIPESDLTIRVPNLEHSTVEANLEAKEWLSQSVISLRLCPHNDFTARAGQYISIVRNEGALVRSYSIANLPERGGVIELHIRKIPNGAMSTWVCDEAQEGDVLHIRGPAGNSFYVATEDNATFPLLLAGTGTGLAPLEGVLLDALAHGHRGSIHLLHGALRHEDLYHVDRLNALAQAHSNLTYTPCVLHAEHDTEQVRAGALDALVVAALKPFSLPETRAYFCGAPEMVNLLKKKAFLAGVPSRYILSDPFIMSSDQRSS